eukprot:749891-Hanusia_phi.AAC.3
MLGWGTPGWPRLQGWRVGCKEPLVRRPFIGSIRGQGVVLWNSRGGLVVVGKDRGESEEEEVGEARQT